MPNTHIIGSTHICDGKYVNVCSLSVSCKRARPAAILESTYV